MKYPRILCVFSIFVIMGIGFTGVKHVTAEEGTGDYQAFKSTDDPAYHQRHNGRVDWHLFHDTPAAETKTDKPINSDIYWIEEGGWQKRIKDVEDTSRLSHLTPANVAESKEQSPCPLCGKPTYFWITGGVDSATEGFIKGDYPDWSRSDGACRNCFECYELRTGNYFGGKPAASTTDIYVIGYNKSARIQDYFANVK